MKPLEFKITQFTDETIETYPFKICPFKITFYYENGTTSEINFIGSIPDGLVLGRHYHIDDMYGNTVINDREGL